MDIKKAKKQLDIVIKKSRVHLYKPIQIAEILYRDRVNKDIDLARLETYRTKSKKWRDQISGWLLGRICTSSARFQDDLFNDNAVPPRVLIVLGEENRRTNGSVEAYIYSCFLDKYRQLRNALDHAASASPKSFDLEEFLRLFNREPGLKRSIDKVYEIVVYALFSVLVDELKVVIEVKSDKSKKSLLAEFEDFTKRVIGIDSKNTSIIGPAKLFRLGVTNAADRGLDMWANFGPVVQIKHLTLDEELAENIVTSIRADRIVIVCKSSEEKVIVSLLTQLGWRSRIQSIVTEIHLVEWYKKALKGKYKNTLGKRLLLVLSDEMKNEFPASDNEEFMGFCDKRDYLALKTRGTIFENALNG